MIPDDIADSERRESLCRILTESSTVLDVGANRGQFAKQLLSGVSCSIISFEPGDAAFEDLSAFAATDPRVRPVKLVVADTTGSVEFFVQESDLGSSLLPPVPDQSSQWATFLKTTVVEATRLDDFIDANELGFVDLLKTDCQGADRRVLESAGAHLAPDDIGALLVELNFHAFYEGQDSVGSVFDLAYDHGYFLASMFRHVNREGWLWWADALFLPNRPPFSTQ